MSAYLNEVQEHRYVAAIDELVKIEGVPNIYLVAKFISATFGVSLGKVLRDAVDQSEVYQRVFAQA